MAQNDDGEAPYCLEHELESTGGMDKRETFYSGASLKVEVDPETGEGRLKYEDD